MMFRSVLFTKLQWDGQALPNRKLEDRMCKTRVKALHIMLVKNGENDAIQQHMFLRCMALIQHDVNVPMHLWTP